MKKYAAFLAAAALSAIVIPSDTCNAHTILKRPFQKRYDFKSVTCYACHVDGKDKDGKRLGKEYLNDLGKDMHSLLAERKFTERIESAKKADSATRKKAHAEIIEEFLESLDQFEQLKSPNGLLWGPLIKDGKIDGVKKKPGA